MEVRDWDFTTRRRMAAYLPKTAATPVSRIPQIAGVSRAVSKDERFVAKCRTARIAILRHVDILSIARRDPGRDVGRGHLLE